LNKRRNLHSSGIGLLNLFSAWLSWKKSKCDLKFMLRRANLDIIGIERLAIVLYPLRRELRMSRSFVPSIVPNGHDQTVYLVLEDFGRLGRSYRETDEERTDLESAIRDLISGQYANPVRIVAFNTAERWAEDASEDVAREIMRRLGLAGDELPSPLEGFVDRHLGPERQLTLRLA
jgi:hypothetical protein